MQNQNLNEESIDNLVRFNPALLSEGKLEVIVKHSGDLYKYADLFQSIEILDGYFAIITGTINQIKELYTLAEIEYIEFPKTLTYELSSNRYATCVSRVQNAPYFLSGRGVAVGIIDSGIDFTHPDFRNDDGTTRIIYIWDQSKDGNAPLGFRSGSEYTKEDIDRALLTDNPKETLDFFDNVGHGTAVAGIASGNGRQSNGREKGMAPNSKIIAVKLGRRGFGAFPKTTEVMRGIKYTIDKARENNLPLSINLSFGTNNGSHDGNSLFEQYINNASNEWKCTICVATGNEGNAGHHYSNSVQTGTTLSIPISVTNTQSKIYMTLLKNFNDSFSLKLISPSGDESLLLTPYQSIYKFNLQSVNINVFYGQPTNYTQYQEIFFLLESEDLSSGIAEGIWTLEVFGESIVDGNFDIWLPTVEDVTENTAFTNPDTNVTLTLPSTVKNVISVGGYNSNTNTSASFSGRGYTRNDIYVKPDIVAPAVNILTTRNGGGYMQYSGTSMACPFVAGACALILEWGIVNGNDIFLYGQRVKAFLQKGAKRTQNLTYPNNIWGYGTLCVSNTLDLLERYNNE